MDMTLIPVKAGLNVYAQVTDLNMCDVSCWRIVE
jgi:hypothetical protein